MSSRITLKDHFRETTLFNHRAIFSMVFSILLIMVIMIRLVYLQIVEHDRYTTLSEENRFFIAPIPPTRGLIYDRNGILLAENLPTYTLELVPERIQNMDATIDALKELITISDDDIEDFKKQVKHSRRFKPIPLRTRLTEEEIARISVNRHRFTGVDIAARLIRHYPNDGLAVHALGYTGRINAAEEELIDKSNYEGTDYIGKLGVEHFYEDTMHGIVGVQHIETNAQGRALRSYERVPPESGVNLYLTLDAKIQKIAEEALGEESGSVVALNPKDGSIIVFASTPVFDPNQFVEGIGIKPYRALQQDPQKPLFNRALRGQYPPGSTVKPFYALAGLEYGLTESEIKTRCPGWYVISGDTHRYRDWKKTGHGQVDVETAIVQSCDVYFYDLALTLGIDRMNKFMLPFGFDARTGIDIAGESKGLMPSRKWKRRKRNQAWYLGETLIAGIGQGYVLATPLQLASATATLAMYGKRVQPRIVAATQLPDSGEKHFLESIEDTPVEIVDRKNWEKVIDSMTKVVHHWRGTAKRIGKDSKYKIAGKTGTAQVFSVKQDEEYKEHEVPKKLRDHALFIAFAPAEDPQIAISVIVENGGHGGSTAAPIARKVMDAYLLPRLFPDAENAQAQKSTSTQ